jgi:hypothetical protein
MASCRYTVKMAAAASEDLANFTVLRWHEYPRSIVRRGYALVPDGKTYIIIDPTLGSITRYDVDSGAVVATLDWAQQLVQHAVCVCSNTTLAAVCGGELFLWTLATGACCSHTAFPGATTVIWASSGLHLILRRMVHPDLVMDCTGGTEMIAELRSPETDNALGLTTFSSDGLFVGGCEANLCYIFELASMELFQTIETTCDIGAEMCLSAGAAFLACVTEDSKCQIYNITAGLFTATVGDDIVAAMLDMEHNRVLTLAIDGQFSSYALLTGELLQTWAPPEDHYVTHNTIPSVLLGRTDSLLSHTFFGKACIRDTFTGQVQFYRYGQLARGGASADGNTLMFVHSRSMFIVRRMASMRMKILMLVLAANRRHKVVRQAHGSGIPSEIWGLVLHAE